MIRAARLSDIGVLSDLVDDFFSVGNLDGTGLSFDEESTIEFLSSLVSDQSAISLVDDRDGVVIGGICGTVYPWHFNRGHIILHEIGWFVQERTRKTNPTSASRLLSSFLKEGRNRGATTVILSSNIRPEAGKVQRLYEHLGLQFRDASFIGRL